MQGPTIHAPQDNVGDSWVQSITHPGTAHPLCYVQQVCCCWCWRSTFFTKTPQAWPWASHCWRGCKRFARWKGTPWYRLCYHCYPRSDERNVLQVGRLFYGQKMVENWIYPGRRWGWSMPRGRSTAQSLPGLQTRKTTRWPPCASTKWLTEGGQKLSSPKIGRLTLTGSVGDGVVLTISISLFVGGTWPSILCSLAWMAPCMTTLVGGKTWPTRELDLLGHLRRGFRRTT